MTIMAPDSVPALMHSTPVFCLATALAVLAIYTDTRPVTRRLLLACCFVLVMTAGVWAITIMDPCSVPPLSEMSWWERLLLGCF